jgi:predicted MFS family arabinose efflux permease
VAGAWAPLRHRQFAVLWSAGLVSSIGTWMHDLAAGWFMATLDPTPYMVALVQAAYTLPVCLLSIPAGTLADRMDKRQLLLLVQWIMLLLAALLGVMVLGGSAGEVTLLLVTLGIGGCVAVMSPTWQAIIPGLVPRHDLQQAVALHAVSMNISRAIGPAIAGVVIASFGMAWPFLINAASFLAVIVALWMWQTSNAPRAGHAESYLASLRGAFSQVGSNRALRHTLLRSVLFFLFGSCYWALLPLVAHDHLQGDARLFGMLVGCIGVGAVATAFVLPVLRIRWGLDTILHIATVATAATLAGYALLRLPALGMLASLLAGSAWLAALSSLIVSAQIAVPDALRGRGMAMFSAVFYGCLAVGSLLWGQVATYLSLADALLLAGGGALAGLLLARKLPLGG